MPIQLTTRPDFRKHEQRVELDGVIYRIVLTWRQRVKGWYLDLYSRAGDPIALGRRLNPKWSPTFGSTSEDLPSGALVVVGPDEYSRSDLGDSLRLLYYTRAELLG